MTSKLRSIVTAAALSAALAGPAAAQQYVANVHVERPGNGQTVVRTELNRGSTSVLRADRLGSGTRRVGALLPLKQGWVSAFGEQSDSANGYALNWDLGSQNLMLGGALERRETAGRVKNVVNAYATSVSDHHRVSLGTARVGTENAVHGIAYGFAGDLVAGIGAVKQGERSTRFHGSVARVSPEPGKQAAGYLYWTAEPGKTSLDLWLAPKGRWGRAVGIGPNQMHQYEHDRTLRAVDDIISSPMQPGIPLHMATAGGKGALRVQYVADGADKHLVADTRVFPGRVAGIDSGILANVMTGYRHDVFTGEHAGILEVQVPVGRAGKCGTWVSYAETASEGKPYLFTGLYVPVGSGRK